MSAPPHFWNVIPPDQTISRHVEVLLALDSTILSVDNLESVDQVRGLIPYYPFPHSPQPEFLSADWSFCFSISPVAHFSC
jgi:hypothetical protein